MDLRLSFGEHLQIATAKAIQFSYCGSLVDNAEHTLFFCARWGVARESVGREMGAQLTPDTMVSLMLQSEQKWVLIESFVAVVMKTRELDGCVERGNNGGQ